MSVVEVLNDPEHAILCVYTGTCGHLRETGSHVAVPKALLPDDYEKCALQCSICDELYWILLNGNRYNNRVFCSKCGSVINGSGSNLRPHASIHNVRVQFTEEQQGNAFLLFLLRHQIGLTATRDPLVRVFQPNVSFARLLSKIEPTVHLVRERIRSELTGKDFFVMVDGWSDQSLRRFLGVVAGFYSSEKNTMVFRFLDLYSRDGRDHSARAQQAAIHEILQQYSLRKQNCYCLVSDSASVNARLAEDMSLDWCPCAVHLWNIVVQNFIKHCPETLTDLLSRINKLRKKTGWAEFLVGRSNHRNIAGYCPTRWCSVCECLKAFYDMRLLVFEYQGEKEPMFSTADTKMIEEIGPLLERFVDVNGILTQADYNQGLVSVFEALNAIYMILQDLAQNEGDFQSAYVSCRDEVQQRFFNTRSKFCCRLLFSGLLNVQHSLPSWMESQMELIVALLVAELELFTGGTPPQSPREPVETRYTPNRPLIDTIAASPAGSEASTLIYDEIREFLQVRGKLSKQNFTVFWRACERFRHLSTGSETSILPDEQRLA